MPAYYSVVQYIPSEIAGECINVGVVAFDENSVQCRFLRDWTRVKCFVSGDIHFLREIAADFEKATASQHALMQPEDGERLTPDKVRAIAKRWSNTLQLTRPRGSLLDVDALLQDIAGEMLCEPQRTLAARPRSRGTARALLAGDLTRALHDRYGEQGDHLLRRKYELTGKNDKHIFDLSVANGHPYYVVNCHSFEIDDTPGRDDQLAKTKWAITDLRESKSSVPVAVFVLKPKRISTVFDEFARVMRRMKAEVVDEQDRDGFVKEVLGTVPPALDFAPTSTAAEAIVI